MRLFARRPEASASRSHFDGYTEIPNKIAAVGPVEDAGVENSSNYWLGSVAVDAPLLDLGSPGFEPRSGLSFHLLQKSPYTYTLAFVPFFTFALGTWQVRA
jgi:hypothetical protein